MNLIQHRTDLTEIGLGFTGYFPFPDFWSLGSGISEYCSTGVITVNQVYVLDLCKLFVFAFSFFPR